MSLAADLIKGFEGCERKQSDGSLTAYQDTRGRWTIGWGCTGRLSDGRLIAEGLTISQAEADAELEHRLNAVTQVARGLCPGANPNQFAAMCSFAWNEGTHALAGSKIVSLLNAGDSQGAADDFLQWERAGSDPHILHNRRMIERALFLKPC